VGHTKRVARISPWQAGKLFAVIYFAMSLVFVVPLGVVSTFAPMPKFLRLGFVVLLPFLYGLFALVVVPLGCWVYNVAASLVGGLEVSISDEGGS
jgi:hypothetical protein